MDFMLIALKEAEKALLEGEVPVGAVIVKDNQIIAKAHNQRKKSTPCILHAEILAIKKACKKLNNERLDGCDIYITLEPCLMCAGAIALTHIRKVYFSLKDEKYGALVSTNNVYESKNLSYVPEYLLGDYNAESKALLQKFFKDKRLK